MKYELNQVVHYMRDNKPHSAPVLARMRVDNLRQEWANTKEMRSLFTPFGPSGAYYSTCHGIVREDEAFDSEADLFASLRSA